MKSQTDKFSYKRILQHIIKEQSSLNTFRAFLKATLQGEQKSLNAIQLFTKDMRQASSKVKSKEISKCVQNFSIHKLELQQIPIITELIQKKLYFWIEEVYEKLKSVKEKAKAMENRKNSLTQQQIKSFKTQLTQEFVQINQKKESLVKLFCYNMIKNGSHQLQRITDLLKNQFENGNRDKRQSK